MRDVSVVIPCRNGATFLAQTIRSVLNQTVPPREILVVDDGSTDDSRSIAERYSPPVRVISGPAEGAAVARNTGAAAASGERLMFLDADDLLTPPTLGALGTALDGRDGSVAICPWDRYELEGEAWIVRPPSAALVRPGQDRLDAWLTGSFSPPCTILWTRKGFDATGGWLQAAGLDDDGNLMRRALARGIADVWAPDGLSLYRRLPGEMRSYSARLRETFGLRSRLASLTDTVDELERAGRLEQYRGPLGEAIGALARDAVGHALARDIAALCRRAGGEQPTLGYRARIGGARARIAARRAEWRRASTKKPQLSSHSTDLVPPIFSGPLVSVIIPTFNRRDDVIRAVRSVLNQSYRDLELVVVDDGSTDGTARSISDIANPRLTVIEQPNGGVARARNRGLAEARGGYIAFLDSDDFWYRDKLAHQIAALEAAPQRNGFCHTAIELRSDAGFLERRSATAQGRFFEPLLLDNHVHAPTSSGVIRREVFDAVGGFDPALPAIEDWEWLQRVARLYDLLAVDLVLTVYNDEETTSEERRSRNFRANMTAREMLWQRNRHALRRCGMAHLYLIESARRELREPDGDARKGRQLVLRALAERPQHKAHWCWLPYMATPFAIRKLLRRLDEPRFARRMGTEGTGR